MEEGKRSKACKGKNCSSKDGSSHSAECLAEHEAIVNAAARADHITYGGWKCCFCGYGGQDNTRGNWFCARCSRHR